jgi:hypothetical protein
MQSLITTEMETTPGDPAHMIDDIAAMFVGIYRDLGDEGLRELLERLLEIFDRESLQRDAKLLEQMGLLAVADIVLEYVDRALPGSVMHCPYEEDDGHGGLNYKCWQAAYQRRQLRLAAVPQGRM